MRSRFFCFAFFKSCRIPRSPPEDGIQSASEWEPHRQGYTRGGWFLSFAFPVLGGIALIVTTVVTLCYYLKKGRLYVFGGAAVALGGLMLLTEFLLNFTFAIPRSIGWSLYPLAALGILGGLLIFLAICRPARESMERKFFI